MKTIRENRQFILSAPRLKRPCCSGFSFVHFLVLATLLLLPSASWRKALAQEFDVEGVMTITAKRRPVEPLSCRMRVCYQDCQWSISEAWETVGGTNILIRILAADTNFVYMVDHIETMQLDGFPVSAPSNSWVGKIYAKGFPNRLLEPEAVILFYAYASSCYLDSSTNGLVDPIKFEPPDLENGDALARAKFTRNADMLRLPSEMCFFDSGRVRTNAVLTTANHTNISGIQIPLKVQVMRYARDGGELCLFDFVARSVKLKCGLASFKPDLPVRTFVADFRFSHGAAYVPPVAHGLVADWPEEAAAKLKPGYRVIQMDWESIQRTRPKPSGGY